MESKNQPAIVSSLQVKNNKFEVNEKEIEVNHESEKKANL